MTDPAAPSSAGPAADAAPLAGSCDPRFEGVRAALRDNLDHGGELGAAVCVRVGGRTAVDLWGGFADRRATRPWRRDTLVNAYSVGKGLLAILVLRLVDAGELELDRPVARVWPAFAAGDKGGITLRDLLCHRAGLPAVRRPLPEGAQYDWPTMCGALASQEPWWTPGTRHGYHCNTLGFLLGEVIRRRTGTDVAAMWRERVTGPLGAGFHFGLPEGLHARVAEVDAPGFPMDQREKWAAVFPPTGDPVRDEMIWHTYANPAGLSGMGTVNTRRWREAVIPSTNGHGTARAVARIYDAFLRGGRAGAPAISRSLWTDAITVHADGEDAVLGRPSRFGLGFQLSRPGRPIGRGDRGHGHYGYGGSLGFADPDADLSFAFLTNRPGDRWQTPRTQALVDAVYDALS